MKTTAFTFIMLLVVLNSLAQNDTIYFLKNGLVVNKQSIKAIDIDSVIFYSPTKDPKPFDISFVSIPAGSFIMGSPETEVERSSNESQHEVTLAAFKMSKHEITNVQYAEFLNSKGVGQDGKDANGKFPSEKLIYSHSWGLTYTNNQWIPVQGHENYPVINVTWFGATEFAAYKGAALPTEAQWEYACRAGTTTPFNTGNCLSNEQANYRWKYPYIDCTNTNTSEPGKTQIVGTYPANAFGLHDMHGNVSEWCADLISFSTSSSEIYRVIRGGYYRGIALECRSARRSGNYPNGYGDGSGFRIVIN